MLYVLGDRVDAATSPRTVTAESYRAYPIQNFDTAAMRCMTTNGVELLFTTSHAVGQRTGPRFIYEFERGTVRYDDGSSADITATFHDGSTKNYGSPDRDRMRKLWLTIASIERGSNTICGINAAAAQTRCNWAIQLSSPEITAFPANSVHAQGATGERQLIVEGLAQDLIACHDQAKLPSELGFSWANPGKTIALETETAPTQIERNAC
jgi:hypothetical protein